MTNQPVARARKGRGPATQNPAVRGRVSPDEDEMAKLRIATIAGCQELAQPMQNTQIGTRQEHRSRVQDMRPYRRIGPAEKLL
jgi:hypothetical protein